MQLLEKFRTAFGGNIVTADVHHYYIFVFLSAEARRIAPASPILFLPRYNRQKYVFFFMISERIFVLSRPRPFSFKPIVLLQKLLLQKLRKRSSWSLIYDMSRSKHFA